MKLQLALFLLFAWGVSAAQTVNYTPSQSKLPSKKKFEERLTTNLEKDILSLDNSKRNRKEIEDIFTNRANYIQYMAIEEDEYIFNTPLNHYIDVIFQKLITSTPTLANDSTYLLISRDYSPNVSSFGEGTIVMNIGLIRRLENESQIAFVLAHELAHQQNNHVNDAIINGIHEKNDRATQMEIKRIHKMKYGRNEAGRNLLKNVPYNSSRHSRLKESEADFAALTYLSNAGYNLEEAVNALKLLDEIDEEKYNEEIIIHREFTRDLYPFKPEWKVEENPLTMFFEENSEEKLLGLTIDSLKTHPNCLVRADALKKEISAFKTGDVFQQSKEKFDEAVLQADFDLVLSAYHYKQYGYAIYQSLQLQQIYGPHPFLTGIIGATMGEMAKAIDNHELGLVLVSSSPEYSDNYNELLSFLNNLSETEMIEVGYNYVRIYNEQASESEALTYALALTSKLKKKNNETNTYRSIYSNNFSGGYFQKMMRKL